MEGLKVLVGREHLKDALSLREEVFIKEQNVPIKIERDSYDEESIHFVVYKNQDIIGCGRIVKHDDGKIYLTRIAVKSSYRNKGIGKILVEYMLLFLKEQGEKVCYIHSQSYIKEFYENLGFIAFGEEFEEAGIMHTHMKYILI